jgi:hypothetical protein
MALYQQMAMPKNILSRATSYTLSMENDGNAPSSSILLISKNVRKLSNYVYSFNGKMTEML